MRSVAFSPDGRKIASGSKDGVVRMWNIRTEHCPGMSSNVLISDKVAEYSSYDVASVLFSSDGKRIVAGSFDGHVRIWDCGDHSEQKKLSLEDETTVFGVDISQDGRHVASTGTNGKIHLWDSNSGRKIGVPLKGHSSAVNCVSFHPNGRYLVSGSDDKALRLWDLETFSQYGSPFEGHPDFVFCVSFSSDGNRIVSGSQHTAIRQWNSKVEEQIQMPLDGYTAEIVSVSESSDGIFVVSRDVNLGTIIWNRRTRANVWISNQPNVFNTINNEEAERIVRSCGQNTPHLWPVCFPEYTDEVYCEEGLMYSNSLCENPLLGSLPSLVRDWKYNRRKKVFVAGLQSGAVAICRFVD